MSNALGLEVLATNEASPEVAFNDNFESMTQAITERLDVDVDSADGAVTTANSQRAALVNVKNCNDSNRKLVFAAVRRLMFVSARDATNTQPLIVKCGTTELILANGSASLYFLDGTANGLSLVMAAGGGGGGGSLPSGGSTGQVLTKNSNSDGDAGWADATGGGGGGGDLGVANKFRYFKLEIEYALSTTYPTVGRFGIRETVGGSPVTVVIDSYSGQYNTGDLAAANMINYGVDDATGWCPGDRDKGWIILDAGALKLPAQFYLKSVNGAYSSQSARSYKLRGSTDKTVWVDLGEGFFDTGSGLGTAGTVKTWGPLVAVTKLPPGGTTGQVLAKNSGADGDASWINP